MALAKKLFVAAACMVIATSASALDKHEMDTGPGNQAGAGLLDCTGASEITCGDSQTNSAGPGAGNVTTYGCTGLSYNDAVEFVYELCVGGDGDVNLTMTYTHDGSLNDLDLFLLGSCDESDCIDASLATSGTEVIDAVLTEGTYYVVVDGWGGRQDGSAHSLSVTCDNACTTPIEPKSWGEIKGEYRD